MDFRYDELLHFWITEYEFHDCRIEVRLYCKKNADFSLLATRAINDVESHWTQLRKAIVEELLPQYLDQASDDLDADGFLSQVKMETVDFDTVDITYAMYFKHGGMFGGHGIQVLWDPEGEFSADVSLVG